MTEIKGLKGFYDRYPEEWASWRKLIDTVEETAREFGFRELNAPSVERADLYRVKSGEEMMDQMYSFTDKGEREISLIPEQTPTRARLVQQRKDLKTPVKWFDTSKRWRYEEVQRGRDREFFQTDFDIFGVESVEADAEIIACAATVYKKLGVENRVEFLINDRKLTEAFLDAYGIENRDEVMRQVIDDKEKMGTEEFVEELEEKGLSRDEAEKVEELTAISGPVMERMDKIEDKAPEEATEAVDRMSDLAEALDSYGVADMCKVDLSIIRGFAYYTGIVFEAFYSEGELRALFGGGRYDTLVGMFGGEDVPAVGFAFGYSTTIELLKKEDEWPLKDIETDVYVLEVSDSVRNTALEYASELRGEGLKVETDLTDRGFGDQLSYGDSINAEKVLIVGEKDLENGEVTVKDMETGGEELVDRDRVVEYLSQ